LDDKLLSIDIGFSHSRGSKLPVQLIQDDQSGLRGSWNVDLSWYSCNST